jgi:hypothetical protein
MQLLQDAGIYVLVDMQVPGSSSFDSGVDKYTYFGESSLSFWNSIVDSLHQFTNVLGFVVSLTGDRANIAYYLALFRSHVRDVKAHIKSQKYREIPVGADAWGNGALPVLDFMTCGSPETAIDFLSLLPPSMDSFLSENSSSLTSVFYKMADDYKNASVPIVLSYGHEANSSQDFGEIQTLYSAPVTDVFSGVNIMEWIQNDSGVTDMGMTSISPVER